MDESFPTGGGICHTAYCAPNVQYKKGHLNLRSSLCTRPLPCHLSRPLHNSSQHLNLLANLTAALLCPLNISAASGSSLRNPVMAPPCNWRENLVVCLCLKRRQVNRTWSLVGRAPQVMVLCSTLRAPIAVHGDWRGFRINRSCAFFVLAPDIRSPWQYDPAHYHQPRDQFT